MRPFCARTPLTYALPTHTRAHALALFVHAACMVYVHPRSTEKSFVLLDKASGGVPASSISDELAELSLARQNAAKGAFLEAQFLLTCLRCHAAPARAPRRVPHATPPPVRTCHQTGQRVPVCGVRAARLRARVAGRVPARRLACALARARTTLTHVHFTHTHTPHHALSLFLHVLGRDGGALLFLAPISPGRSKPSPRPTRQPSAFAHPCHLTGPARGRRAGGVAAGVWVGVAWLGGLACALKRPHSRTLHALTRTRTICRRR